MVARVVGKMKIYFDRWNYDRAINNYLKKETDNTEMPLAQFVLSIPLIPIGFVIYYGLWLLIWIFHWKVRFTKENK